VWSELHKTNWPGLTVWPFQVVKEQMKMKLKDKMKIYDTRNVSINRKLVAEAMERFTDETGVKSKPGIAIDYFLKKALGL
jgi:hypothetical protein